MGISVRCWLALVLVGALSTAHGAPEFRAVLETPEVCIGAKAVVEITVSWQEQAGRSWRVLAPQMPEAKHLTLEGIETRATSFPDKGGVRHEVRFVCTLKPDKVGLAETGPIGIRYLSANLAQAAANVDTQHATHEIKSLIVQVQAPSRTWLWATLAVSVGAVLAVIVGVIVVVVKKARRDAQPGPPVRAEADAIEPAFLDRLRALRTLRIEGDAKAYVGKIAELLTDYIERKYGSAAPQALVEHLGDTKTRVLAEILDIAEKLRYAGAPPTPTELDRMAAFAESLLREHMPQDSRDALEDIRLRDP